MSWCICLSLSIFCWCKERLSTFWHVRRLIPEFVIIWFHVMQYVKCCCFVPLAVCLIMPILTSKVIPQWSVHITSVPGYLNSFFFLLHVILQPCQSFTCLCFDFFMLACSSVQIWAGVLFKIGVLELHT